MSGSAYKGPKRKRPVVLSCASRTRSAKMCTRRMVLMARGHKAVKEEKCKRGWLGLRWKERGRCDRPKKKRKAGKRVGLAGEKEIEPKEIEPEKKIQISKTFRI